MPSPTSAARRSASGTALSARAPSMAFDPSDPEFGAQIFAGSPGQPGFGVHSDYWESGNPALTELGRIITGP
ncbi:hypothetical protein [Rhodococcus erythropolis]|uniref:Uncharacterized protein n=1 Tax=Rhodococcus erythropolis TaxID=1833 RepID=A0A8I1A023_RHOER|nr:hypothetical protein [Rhodococcus erythropolis]MBH5144552.1 hypothetical protein [Rhodococcus erythropolis]